MGEVISFFLSRVSIILSLLQHGKAEKHMSVTIERQNDIGLLKPAYLLNLVLVVFAFASFGYSEAFFIRAFSEQVSFLAEDGVQLTGRLVRPVSEPVKTAVIMVHGGFRADNDYPMMNRFSSIFASKSFTVLLLNMRRGVEFTTSVFEDSVKDIRAAVQFIRTLGFGKIFLAGHSNGAHEVTYYAAQTRDESVVALGLYAAASTFKFSVRNFLGEQRYTEITNQAKDLVSRGLHNQVVHDGPILSPSPSVPPPLPISARTWISWFGPESNLDTPRWIRLVPVPVLIVIHESDGRLPPWSQRYFESSSRADLKLYTNPTTGNPHYFEGFEGQVVQDTTDWLGRIIGDTTREVTTMTTTEAPKGTATVTAPATVTTRATEALIVATTTTGQPSATAPSTITATRTEGKPSQVSPSPIPDYLIPVASGLIFAALAGSAVLWKRRSRTVQPKKP